MSDYTEEILTKVKVQNNTDTIDAFINTLEADTTLSKILSPLIEHLKENKKTIDNGITSLAERVGERIGSYQEQFIRMNQSVDTGLMASSIETETVDDGEVIVGNTAHSPEGFPYPLTIEYGRGEVRPKNGKVLRWTKDGETIFSRYSGPTQPKPFHAPSIEYIRNDVDEFFENEIMKKIRS